MNDRSLSCKDLKVCLYPDPVLRQKCEEVCRDGFGMQLRELASCMLGIMYAEAGVGLAAPQIGFAVKVIVADPSRDQSSPLALVNPRIVDAKGDDTAEEGCLSIPRVRARLHRHERITVAYQTLDRREDCIDATGLLARILQHETDHLDGVLFIDRLGPTDRFAVKAALRRLRSAAKQLKGGRE